MKRLFFTFALMGGVLVCAAKSPRVFPKGKLPDDARLKPLKDLNGHFPFKVPATLEAWEKRSAELRRRILVANGLFPLPKRTPLNAVIHGKVKRPGFTAQKVYFESMPGYYVTGLLFRPEGKARAKRPAVLCPHGHGGRLMDAGVEGVKKYLKSGAEKFAESGRMPKMARAATLARLGNVVLLYDMIGYADSLQLSYQLAHRFAKQRPEMEGKDRWGLFSTQAELQLQSIMGIQTWNSIRCLDFLASLPDVDPKRMAVTGGSGGGTQTILLCAIDSRPIAAFPNGMVSTSMQGGCTCENCALLRVGTGNVELTALFAPKPQGMTAANDWTKAMMTDGYPELQKVYGLYGKKENVFCEDLRRFPHNYNYVTRGLMYDWFNKHMGWGLKEPIVEEDYKLFTKEEQSVWNTKHPMPTGGDVFERKLTKWMADRDAKLVKKMTKKELRAAWATLIGREMPAFKDIEREKVDEFKRDGYIEFLDILRLKKHGEVLPVVSLYPTGVEWNKKVGIGIMGEGKDSLFDEDGEPVEPVRRMLAAGYAVVGADLFQQGEFLEEGQSLSQTRKVTNPREYAGYSFGYNHTLFAHRVHDILTLVAWVSGFDEEKPESVYLVGVEGAGPWVAAARALVGNAVDKVAIETQGFRFADLKSYRDPNFIPGAVKYGDVPGLLTLADSPLWLEGEGKEPETSVVDWLMNKQ